MFLVRKPVLLIALGFLCTACEATSDPAGAADESTVSFEDSYAAAERALAVAESKRNVWSNTHRLLRSAREANDEGRIEEGILLATEARLQAELAVTQAEREKETWRASELPH